MDLNDIPDGPIMPEGAAPEAPADEPLDAVPTNEPAAPPVVESDPNDEPIVPDDTAASAAPTAIELSDDATVKIDGQEYSVKDLKAERLMRADYTRKTTELARERDAMDDFRLEVDLERMQTRDFLERMSNPTELINEFAEHMPEVWDAVIDAIVQREIQLQKATPEGRELILRKEADARRQWRAQRDSRMAKEFDTHRGRATARREAAKNHKGWRDEAMKAAGLDPARDEHHDLVMDGMASPRNRGKAWTKETFDAEAARVAKILGVKAPAPAKAAAPAPAPKPAAPPPALPPQRAPAPPAKAAAAAHVPPRGSDGKFKPKSYEGYWESLRSR